MQMHLTRMQLRIHDFLELQVTGYRKSTNPRARLYQIESISKGSSDHKILRGSGLYPDANKQ